MSLTLLVDLDDTLLGTQMEAFIRGYIGLLSQHMMPYVDPSRMVPTLMSATQQMVVNRRPDRTLEETFDQAFYPHLGIEKESVRASLEQFYQQIYPQLQPLTFSVPGVEFLFEEALRRGWRVAIATNPLYPRQAILHRLHWAGVRWDQAPVEIVPSYETFHFAKPNPAYFAELLGRLDWPDGQIIMIGDATQEDVTGASEMGIPTFWINPDGQGTPAGLTPTGVGRLSTFLSWLEDHGEAALAPDYNLPSALRATLRATPAFFDHLARTVSAETWTQRPSKDEWCLTEVLCHLRDVEADVNLPRLHKMIDERNPFLAGRDTDRWVEERQYITQDYRQALRAFTAARLEVLSILDGLEPDEWALAARHSIFGPTTLKEIIQIMAGHDRLHIQQANKSFTK